MHSKCTIQREKNAYIKPFLSHVFIFVTRFSHYTCITKCNRMPRTHSHIVDRTSNLMAGISNVLENTISLVKKNQNESTRRKQQHHNAFQMHETHFKAEYIQTSFEMCNNNKTSSHHTTVSSMVTIEEEKKKSTYIIQMEEKKTMKT